MNLSSRLPAPGLFPGQGRRAMHIHRSNCLEGPLSGAREWWRTSAAPADLNAGRPANTQEISPREDDPTFRADLVARIRRQLADGTYPIEAHWDAALERLFAQLEGYDD
jgi:hypothetical protein